LAAHPDRPDGGEQLRQTDEAIELSKRRLAAQTVDLGSYGVLLDRVAPNCTTPFVPG
jgi:hypothetical protein